MSLSEQEVRAIVRDEIAKAFGININPDIQYLSTSEAAKALGYKKTRYLYDLIHSGILRLGEEVQDRRRPGSANANYYFNINACVKRLNNSPGKRVK
jgi:hypothetical protein